MWRLHSQVKLRNLEEDQQIKMEGVFGEYPDLFPRP